MAKKWAVEVPAEHPEADGVHAFVLIKTFKKRKEAKEYADKFLGSKNGKLDLVVEAPEGT